MVAIMVSIANVWNIPFLTNEYYNARPNNHHQKHYPTEHYLHVPINLELNNKLLTHNEWTIGTTEKFFKEHLYLFLYGLVHQIGFKSRTYHAKFAYLPSSQYVAL